MNDWKQCQNKSGSDTERMSTHDVRVYPDTSDRYFAVNSQVDGDRTEPWKYISVGTVSS